MLTCCYPIAAQDDMEVPNEEITEIVEHVMMSMFHIYHLSQEKTSERSQNTVIWSGLGVTKQAPQSCARVWKEST